VLGVEAAHGRTFNAGDEAQTASPGIVLSAALWQRRYGSDPSIVGRRVLVNNRPTTVIGVMPAGFRLLLPTDAAVPDDLQAWQLLNATYVNWPRGQQFLRVVGRMKSAVPLDAAQQEIAAIGGGIGREFKDYGSAGLTLYAVGLQDDGVREVRPALLALFGGVGILLVIACVNVAGLLVARAAARAKDTAVRMALGAGRVRLLRQCLTEGVLLAALGGAAGLLAGRAALAALMSLRPDELRRIEAAHLDGAVLAFTAGISLMWGLLLSLAPVVEVFRTDVTTALQRGGRKSGEAIHYRARGALVAAQMALSVVLLVTAVLLVRGFQRLQQVDPGFHADGVLTFRVALPGSRNNTRDALNVFSRNLRAKLAALPGVTATGAISHLPYDDLPNWGTPYLRETAVDESEAGVADSRAITPGYLEAVGAQLVEGRWFTEDDAPKTRPVALVDTRLAERMWPGQSAVGKRLRADPYTTGSPRVTVTIVGVVRHVRHRQLTRDVREQMYFPLAQAPRNPMAYVVRTSGDPAQLAPAVRQALLQLDPALPMYDVRPLADYLRSARAARRFTMTLAAAFAAAALALACIGVYGVTAYAVALRRHEFGVRMALGARAAEIVRLVLREGGVLALAGATAGLTGAGVAAALVRAQLYGVSPFDPLSYALAIAALAAAAFAACWIPARRAGAVSPLESLRAE
jgi:putative ABC transport system permease protein